MGIENVSLIWVESLWEWNNNFAVCVVSIASRKQTRTTHTPKPDSVRPNLLSSRLKQYIIIMWNGDWRMVHETMRWILHAYEIRVQSVQRNVRLKMNIFPLIYNNICVRRIDYAVNHLSWTTARGKPRKKKNMKKEMSKLTYFFINSKMVSCLQFKSEIKWKTQKQKSN